MSAHRIGFNHKKIDLHRRVDLLHRDIIGEVDLPLKGDLDELPLSLMASIDKARPIVWFLFR